MNAVYDIAVLGQEGAVPVREEVLSRLWKLGDVEQWLCLRDGANVACSEVFLQKSVASRKGSQYNPLQWPPLGNEVVSFVEGCDPP